MLSKQNACLSILRLYALPPDELFFKWEAFVLNHLKPSKSGANPVFTLENAKELHKEIQREALAKRSIPGAGRTPIGTHQAGSMAHKPANGSVKRQSGISSGLEFLDFNPATPSAKKPRPSSSLSASNPARQPKQEPASSPFSLPPTNATPRLEALARLNPSIKTEQIGTPEKEGSNSVFSSPSALTPAGSNQFHSRTNALSTTDTLNAHLEPAPIPAIPLSATSVKGRITFSAGADPKDYAYRYMFEKVSERSEVLDSRINDLATHLLSAFPSLPEPADPSVPTSTQIFTVGQITIDPEQTTSKLNDHSLVLQTSRIVGAGGRIPIRFTEGCKVRGGPEGVGSVGLFSGGVWGFMGRNGSGREFWVDEVLIPPPPPFSSTPASEILEMQHGPKMGSQPVSVFAASGPFTLDADLEYEPLEALVEEVKRCRPDCIILMGPFLSSAHPFVKSGNLTLSPTEIFQSKISSRLKDILDTVVGSQIVLVPGVRDLITDQVCFPQGMLDRDVVLPSKRVRLLPNPCLININEVFIGISSVDTLFHLRKETFFKQAKEAISTETSGGGGIGDLMAGVCRSLLHQRSFYPLYPVPIEASADVNLDLTHYDLLKMETCPDVLLLPSNLGKFAKIVDSVIVVNPGRLSQRSSGGTFSKFVIHPIDKESLISSARSAAGAQAGGGGLGEEGDVEHEAFGRIRVDIVRI
ncbi:DNA polymerase alpha-primase complex, polymerase-associated subunit B [Phaffia rhodozyma]|uniref:DNA polymerase alpha subunit B n=1 Tax=Phaffia rhodozyma TaxID=264483 RepID=A0A0F7SKZ1_PHARH|nr:DNA polymerase alpha-primase complex, polymerase-associated subunit B [Phaffia rhodozyma]